MSITSDILRRHTDAIILSHLLDQDSYGYQINKDIMKKTENQYELKEATLPAHLYAIGPSAFADCWQLTSIDIPQTVRYIGSEAFCNSGIREVWLRTIDLETGETIFTPNEQFSKARPLTIHISEEMRYDEVGNLGQLMDAYDEGYNVTFVCDVPYFD